MFLFQLQLTTTRLKRLGLFNLRWEIIPMCFLFLFESQSLLSKNIFNGYPKLHLTCLDINNRGQKLKISEPVQKESFRILLPWIWNLRSVQNKFMQIVLKSMRAITIWNRKFVPCSRESFLITLKDVDKKNDFKSFVTLENEFTSFGNQYSFIFRALWKRICF